MRTHVFPLWFGPEGSHSTVQRHHISVRGGKYLARLCMLFFNGPLLFVFFALLLPPCFGCFLLHIQFFFFYSGNLTFILRATEFVGKPILHTQ